MIAFIIFLVVNVFMVFVQFFAAGIGTMGLANAKEFTLPMMATFALVLFSIGTFPNVILYFLLGKVFSLSGVVISFWIFEGLLIAVYFFTILVAALQ